MKGRNNTAADRLDELADKSEELAGLWSYPNHLIDAALLRNAANLVRACKRFRDQRNDELIEYPSEQGHTGLCRNSSHPLFESSVDICSYCELDEALAALNSASKGSG